MALGLNFTAYARSEEWKAEPLEGALPCMYIAPLITGSLNEAVSLMSFLVQKISLLSYSAALSRRASDEACHGGLFQLAARL